MIDFGILRKLGRQFWSLKSAEETFEPWYLQRVSSRRGRYVTLDIG